jgi:ABC-type antimicrobial peptide transport system permease subunit
VRSLTEPPTPLYYRPFAQIGGARRFVLARSPTDADAGARELRRVVREVDPNLPVLELTTLEEQVGAGLQLPQLAAGMTTVLGALALVLSSVGLYSVVAIVVAQRTREVGIRMSMGALGGDIARLVVAETGKLVAAGLGVGIALALVLTPALRSVLYGTEPSDPMTFLGAAGIIAMVALGASYAPARKAAGLDPVEALRHP